MSDSEQKDSVKETSNIFLLISQLEDVLALTPQKLVEIPSNLRKIKRLVPNGEGKEEMNGSKEKHIQKNEGSYKTEEKGEEIMIPKSKHIYNSYEYESYSTKQEQESIKADSYIEMLKEKITAKYQDCKIKIESLYLPATNIDEKEALELIDKMFISIKEINLEKTESLYIPFAFCKIETKHHNFFTMEFEEMIIPLVFNETYEYPILQSIGEYTPENLTIDEMAKWSQIVNNLQLQLIQMINNEGVKYFNYEKEEKYENKHFDEESLTLMLETLTSKFATMQQCEEEYTIEQKLERIIERIRDENKLWGEEYIEKIKEVLKKNTEKIEKTIKKENEKLEEYYNSLVKMQKELEKETQELKELEKIGRENREQRINMTKKMSDFKGKKEETKKQIEKIQKMKNNQEKWREITKEEKKEELNKKVVEEFKEIILDKIATTIDENNIEEKIKENETKKEKELIINLIKIPISLYHVNGKDEPQKKEMIILYDGLAEDWSILRY